MLGPRVLGLLARLVLTGMLIQSAIEAKKLEFDFLRGDEE